MLFGPQLPFLLRSLTLSSGALKLKQMRQRYETAYKQKVKPVPGCILLCDLVAGEYHSGNYVENKKIVNLEGTGDICLVTPEKFLARMGGLTGAKAIFVSCDEDGIPAGSDEVAERALKQVNKKRDYNLLFDNCHQFTAGCLNDDFENSNNFTWMLKRRAEEYLGAVEWLLWDEYDDIGMSDFSSFLDMLYS